MASASNSTTLTANTGSPYTNATLTASFNETSTSTANNTSNITVTATQKIGNADWSSNYTSTLQIFWYDNNANGGGRLVASTGVKSQGRNATITASGSITVPHRADGSLTGYARAVWTKAGNSNWTPNSGSVATGSTALINIPRAATITSAPNFNDTDNPTIGYSNPAGSAVASLQACIANPAGTVVYAQYRDISISGSSYTFNLTDAERNALRQACANSPTLAVKFYVTTVIGGNTYYSTLDRTMTIVDGNPTFSAAYLDTNSTTTDITNNNQQIIRNQSTVQINVSNISTKKYATISRVYCTIESASYEGTVSGTSATINVGHINYSSNTNVIVNVVDSRGLTTSQTLSLQVLDWSLPTAIITAERQNHFYTPTTLNVDANYASLDSKNEVSIKYRSEPLTSQYGSNLFDYTQSFDPHPNTPPCAIDVELNSDGSLTAHGQNETASPKFSTVASEDISSVVEDGETYILSQTTPDNDFYVVVTATNSTSGNYQQYSCQLDSVVTFTVDKSAYDQYDISIVLFPTSYDRYDNFSLTEAFSLVKESSGTWSSWTSISDNVPTTVQLDNNYAWEVQVRVTDLLGSTTYNITVPRGMPIIFFDRLLSSVGFNCFPQNENSVEVNGVSVMRSVMTRNLTTNLSNLTTGQYVRINLAGINSYGGQLIATADGGIKIGKGVTKVKVSGRILFSTSVVGSQYLRICKNDPSASANMVAWVSDTNTSTTATFRSVDATEALVNVQEGDVIYLYYYAAASSSTIYGQTYGNQTSLTVETVG